MESIVVGLKCSKCEKIRKERTPEKVSLYTCDDHPTYISDVVLDYPLIKKKIQKEEKSGKLLSLESNGMWRYKSILPLDIAIAN